MKVNCLSEYVLILDGLRKLLLLVLRLSVVWLER